MRGGVRSNHISSMRGGARHPTSDMRGGVRSNHICRSITGRIGLNKGGRVYWACNSQWSVWVSSFSRNTGGLLTHLSLTRLEVWRYLFLSSSSAVTTFLIRSVQVTETVDPKVKVLLQLLLCEDTSQVIICGQVGGVWLYWALPLLPLLSSVAATATVYPLLHP